MLQVCLEAREVLSQNADQGTSPLHSPSALLQFTCTSQKGAYILLWSPKFGTVAKGTEPDLLISKPAGSAMAVSQDLHITYFKSCC